MSNELPVIYLARHGETAWSLTGQHTGLTDLPLTERGEQNARALRARLAGMNFGKVFTSPLQRASRTCELAGFGGEAEVDRDLLEWNYGKYEGLEPLYTEYNVGHFARAFRATVGETPYAYVIRRRIEHAQDLELAVG